MLNFLLSFEDSRFTKEQKITHENFSNILIEEENIVYVFKDSFYTILFTDIRIVFIKFEHQYISIPYKTIKAFVIDNKKKIVLITENKLGIIKIKFSEEMQWDEIEKVGKWLAKIISK